jgi:hypothetical protein
MSEKINIIIAAQTNAAVKGLDQVSKSTQRVGQSVQTAQSKMGNFNKSVTAGGVNLRKFAMGGAQQAGYQIGDFAVQVANGTSKMQAFGQQAPQLLQIFGPIGAVVGAAVAIFAAFAVVAEKTKKKTVETASAIDRLNKAFNTLEATDFDSLGESMSAPVQKVFDKYQNLINAAREYAELQRASALGEIVQTLSPVEEMDETRSKLKEALRIQRLMKKQGIDVGENYENHVKVVGELNDKLLRQHNVSAIISKVNGKTRAETAANLDIAIAQLRKAGAYTDEVQARIVKFQEEAGLIGVVNQELDEAAATEKDRLKTLTDSSEKLFYQDGILRLMNIKAGNMSVLFNSMKKAHDERLKTLQDEDTVMGQLVVKGLVFEKSMFQGGRGSDPRLFTQMDEFRKQLADADAAAAKLNDNAPKGLSKIAAKVNGELSPSMKRLNDIMDSVGQSFEDAMMSAVDGTKSTKEAFKSMASEIIKELYRVFVVKQITGFIMSAVGGFFNTNQVSGPSMPLGTGNVRPMARTFAGGGYTGNGPRAGGLDGKGGFMAMLHPRETVTDHTRGQGGGQVVVNQTINVSTGVQQTVRTEIKQLMPQIAESAKSAVVDAKRRGGSYGRAFA